MALGCGTRFFMIKLIDIEYFCDECTYILVDDEVFLVHKNGRLTRMVQDYHGIDNIKAAIYDIYYKALIEELANGNL